MAPFAFRLGGRIALFLEVFDGDPAEITSIAAKIRRMNHDRSDYREDALAVAMQVAFQAAAGAQPAGWHVSINEASAPAFSAGYYGIDVWLNDGEVETERVIVSIRKAAGP